MVPACWRGAQVLAGLGSIALLGFLSGCTLGARSRLQEDGLRADRVYMPIAKGDFRAGDIEHAEPTTTGSRMLIDAVAVDTGVAHWVDANGLPDAIAVDSLHKAIMLAYGDAGTVAVFQGKEDPFAQRALLASELDAVVPDRRLAGKAATLERLIAAEDRVARVGKRLVRALPPSAAATGPYYGFELMAVTPASAKLFGIPPETAGQIVGWVDPDGPAAGQLAAGDLLIAVDGVAVAGHGASDLPPLDGTLTLTTERGAVQRTVQVAPDAWPYAVTVTALSADMPNAWSAEHKVFVTTGLSDLCERDDVLAFAVGHELAHVTLGHSEPKSQSDRVIEKVVKFGILLPLDVASAQIIGGLARGLVNRFNRDQERDADRLGIRYAKAAGYDPHAALVLIDTFKERVPIADADRLFDVHPPYPERESLLNAEISALERQ